MIKKVWNALIAAATLAGVIWFLYFAWRIASVDFEPDADSDGFHTAMVLLAFIYILVVANWGLMASTFYEPLTFPKRSILLGLCAAPFLLYEIHAYYFPAYSDFNFRQGALIAAEYAVTFGPPALCGTVILFANRSAPDILLALSRRLGLLRRNVGREPKA